MLWSLWCSACSFSGFSQNLILFLGSKHLQFSLKLLDGLFAFALWYPGVCNKAENPFQVCSCRFFAVNKRGTRFWGWFRTKLGDKRLFWSSGPVVVLCNGLRFLQRVPGNSVSGSRAFWNFYYYFSLIEINTHRPQLGGEKWGPICV